MKANEKLKIIRAITGATQGKVAEVCGVSVMTVSNFEKGKSDNEKLNDFIIEFENESGISFDTTFIKNKEYDILITR